MALPVVAMLLMSAAKAQADAERAKKSRQEAAIKESVSPWSHIQAGPITEADTFGTLAGGLATGLAQEQAGADAAQREKLMGLYSQNLQLQNNKLAAPANPWASPSEMSDEEAAAQAAAIGQRQRMKRQGMY